MTRVKLQLKSSPAVTIENVTNINIFCSNGMKSYEDKDFNSIPSNENLGYIFISPDETISIAGSEIILLQFINN